MPTYIALINWTQKGIENVKDSPDRLDSWKDVVKAVRMRGKELFHDDGRL